MDSKTEKRHFMQHPEVLEILDRASELTRESDRGAVLIATEWVSEHLRRLFCAVAPGGMSPKKQARILNYPGVLSTLSARIDVAVLCQLIDTGLGQAMHHLRDMRNDAAHSPISFRLREHWDKWKKAFSLGPGIPEWINRIVLEETMGDLVSQLREAQLPDDLGGGPAFKTPDDVIKIMQERHDLVDRFGESLPRRELAVATAMMCALIISYREDRTGQAAGPVRDRHGAPKADT